MTSTLKTSRIKEYSIIFSAIFAVALTYFFFSSNWHIPSRLVLTGTSISGSEIKLGWDSGSGFNDLESMVWDAGIPMKRESNKHIIKIKRIGEKYPSSSSSLVYLTEMIRDGKLMYIDHFGYKKGVRLLSHNLLYFENEGTEFSFETKINTDIQLRFLTNRESGYVEVSLDGDAKQYDLYSKKDEDKTIYRRVKKCAPGEFSVSTELPRYNIERIKVEAFKKGGLFKLTSATIVSDRGRIDLPIRANETVSELIFSGFDRGTENYFHPVRFFFQVLFSSFIAYLSICIMKFTRLRGGIKEVFFGGKRIAFWLMFAGSTVTFSAWLIAYWPGSMTTDSIDIWRVAKIPGGMINDHPFLNMVYYKFLQQIYDHIAIVGIFQILATAALGSYVFYSVYKAGVRWSLIFPFYLLFALSVPIGLYSITLWKDIPFALLVLFWALYLAVLYFRKKSGEKDLSYEKLIALFVALAGLCLIRYNGIVYIVVIPAVILIFRLLPARKTVTVAFPLLISSIAIVIFIFPAVVKIDFVYRQSSFYLDKLKSIRPAAKTKRVFKRYVTILDVNKNRGGSDPWIKNSITVGWHQNFTKRRGYNDFVRYYHHKPLSMLVFNFMETVHRWSYRKPWVYFSWDPFYLSWLLPVAFLLFRIFPISAIFSCIVLSQVVLLLAVIGTVNYRYYYFLLISSYFLVPLAVLDLKLRKER